MDAAALLAFAMRCAPLIDPSTVQALVAVESAANPNAIGVVAGALERQPKTFAEALATAQELEHAGWNFSLGLAQINVKNVRRLGLTLEEALKPCTNLKAMQTLLCDCYERASEHQANAQVALRAALSCYYSGNFTSGVRDGYVRRVVSFANPPSALAPLTPPPRKATP